jgi:TonB-linked SusC/RagA family outer membrane protein
MAQASSVKARIPLSLAWLVAALSLLPTLASAQEPVTLSGRVTTGAGTPLGSASIAIEQLGVGGLTRADGSYAILIPAARVPREPVTVTAKLIGYKPQAAQVNLASGSQQQDFSLVDNPLQLGELVVTGAGTVSEVEKLGNVRNYVEADQIQKSNEPNVVQSLAGKAPNVQVQQSGGEPGSSSYITIRGTRTVGLPGTGAGQPLFVVDGVPVDNSSVSTSDFNPTDGLTSGEIEGTTQTNRMSDVNPNDIESVEILKGAAAGALYGARAGQGVVLITTKKGKAGPTRYSLRSSVSVDNVIRKYPLQTRYGQGLSSLSPDGFATAASGTPVTGDCDQGVGNFECRTSWGPDLSGTGTPVFDHSNEAYRTGTLAENALTVSGGNDRTTFFLSGEYMHNNGIFTGPNNSYQRAGVRLNGSHRITDNLKVAANVAYSDARGKFLQRGNNTNGLQLGLLRSPPDWNNLPYLDPVTGLHRTFRFQKPTSADAVADRGWDNPFFVLFEPEATAQTGRVFGNVNAEFVPVGWLKLNYTLGGDYSNDERLEGAPQSAAAPQLGGRIVEGKLINYQIDHNLTATASYRVSPSFSGSVTVGQNLNSRNFRQLGNVGRTLIAPKPFKLSNTVTRDTPIDAEQAIHSESYFGQATFDFFEQLYLTAALRNDGSSTFDKNHRRSWFPKASAAWTFTKVTGENPALSYGKLRVAYGEAGQEPDPYLTSNIFDGSTLVGGYTQGTGSNPSQGGFGGLASSIVKGADQLRPERTKEFEAGVDLGLLGDRADLSFTYYRAITTDVILLAPLAPSSGYEREARNAAKFRNAGAEVSLNIRPITKGSFAWDVGLMWGKNQSRVLDLGGPEFVKLDPNNNSPFSVVQKGEEVGVYRDQGLVRCGISPNGLGAAVPDVDLATVCGGAARGAYYIDATGFPVVDENERIVGNPNPRWTGSVRTGLRFKKISLSGLLDIKHGGQVYNGTKSALYAYGTHKDTEARAACDINGVCTGNEHVMGAGDSPIHGPVVGPGAGTAVPIGENWYTGIGGLFGGGSEESFEDGGYVKLREITFGFTLDYPWVQRALGFSSIDLRVAGRNLKTWTKYTGYDPESTLGGSQQATRGFDYFVMPQNRSFVFSVTLNR